MLGIIVCLAFALRVIISEWWCAVLRVVFLTRLIPLT